MRIEWQKGTRGFVVVPDDCDRPLLHKDQRGPWPFKTFDAASRFAEAVELKLNGAAEWPPTEHRMVA